MMRVSIIHVAALLVAFFACSHALPTGLGRTSVGNDDAFMQPVVLKRYLFEGAQSEAPWPHLPFPTSARKLEVLSSDSSNILWAFTNASVYAIDIHSDLVEPVTFSPAVNLTASSQVVFLSGNFSSGSAYALLLTDAVMYSIHCLSPAECRMLHLISPPWTSVNSVAFVESEETMYVATSTGLWTVKIEENLPKVYQQVAVIGSIPVLDVAANDDSSLVAAITGLQVYWFNASEAFNTPKPGNPASNDFTWTMAFMDDSPASVAVTNDGDIFIANHECVAVRHYVNGTWTRLGRFQGLPTVNISSVAFAADADGDSVWFAGANGIMRLNYTDGFRVFHGDRWLTGNNISSVAVFSDFQTGHPIACAASTDRAGLSCIRLEQWTYGQKAAHIQHIVELRHNRYGLVADSTLDVYGDVSTSHTTDSDNDGLWTSIYVASQCFRYAVTRDEEARQQAWKSFEAMEFLNNVTGIDGLMARSFNPVDVPTGPEWHNSTAYPGWQWKGDASSDEVVGHLWVYPLVYDLVAETDAEKARVLRLISNITSYIVRNNFTLVDVTGKPTTWGHWDPATIVRNPLWFDERGVNSLQILSYLKSAVHYIGDEVYTDALKFLVAENGYDVNTVNLKITVPDDVNYSDDELTYLPYFLLGHVNGYTDTLRRSLMRTQTFVGQQRKSLWNIIFLSIMGNEIDSNTYDRLYEDLHFDLQRWPVDLIDWPYDNTFRQDLVFDERIDRHGGHQGYKIPFRYQASEYRAFPGVLGRDERQGGGEWTENPYEQVGGSGHRETAAAPYLLSYWMAQYFDLL